MDISYYKRFEPIDGKWYITKELGSGSFGRVFEIERRDYSNMKSALKIISIPGTDGEVQAYRDENSCATEQDVSDYFYGFVEEVINEFQIMSVLKGHSNIVSYEDHEVIKRKDSFGWDIFIRMELLTPLPKFFTDNPPSKEDIIKLGIDMCKALEICQKNNIIHRDIKPSNIFVSGTGDYKLGDFGVAKTLEKSSKALSKKGTYIYMAPEVYRGESYGANVDIYSLGILMYKLLNNNFEPFRTNKTYEDSEAALERRLNGGKLPNPANAGDALSAVVLKACAFNPNERYITPMQMRADLENLLIGKTPAHKAPQAAVNQQRAANEFESQLNKTVAFTSVQNARASSQSPNVYNQPPVQTPNTYGQAANQNAYRQPVTAKPRPDIYNRPNAYAYSYPMDDPSKKQHSVLLPVLLTLLVIVVASTAGALANHLLHNRNSDTSEYVAEPIEDSEPGIKEDTGPETDETDADESAEDSKDEKASEETVNEEESKKATEEKEETPVVQSENKPFWGIWCFASQTPESAESIASSLRADGFDANVFVTSDWSNLNPETYYAVSAGEYSSEEAAQSALAVIQAKGYTDAYVKYTGNHY